MDKFLENIAKLQEIQKIDSNKIDVKDNFKNIEETKYSKTNIYNILDYAVKTGVFLHKKNEGIGLKGIDIFDDKFGYKIKLQGQTLTMKDEKLLLFLTNLIKQTKGNRFNLSLYEIAKNIGIKNPNLRDYQDIITSIQALYIGFFDIIQEKREVIKNNKTIKIHCRIQDIEQHRQIKFIRAYEFTDKNKKTGRVKIIADEYFTEHILNSIDKLNVINIDYLNSKSFVNNWLFTYLSIYEYEKCDIFKIKKIVEERTKTVIRNNDFINKNLKETIEKINKNTNKQLRIEKNNIIFSKKIGN